MTRKRIILRWGIVLLTVLTILGIGLLVLSVRWKPVLSEKLKAGVRDASGGLYRVDFKDIHLQLLTGSATMDGLVLQPDTARYRQLAVQKKAPVHLFRLRMDRLKISGVGILSAYFKKKVEIHTILLDKPSIDMIYHQVVRRPDTPQTDSTLYQKLAKTIRLLSVKTIRINEADFDYYEGEKKLNRIQKLNLRVNDLLIDSLAEQDTSRVFYSRHVAFELAGYRSKTKDGMYEIRLDTLRGSLVKKELMMKGLKLIPQYAEIPFSRKYSVQKDRYDLKFSQIALTGVDFVKLNEEGRLHLKQLSIGPAKVAIFMNRSLPPPAIDKGRNFPHMALKRLPFPTDIQEIKLQGVDVAYTEFEPSTEQKGTVKLQNVQGTIHHVSNDSLQLLKQRYANAALSTLVMGAGKMDVKINFDLLASDGAFRYEGKIGAFDMKVLNPLSEPLGKIRIESGYVNSAAFAISANRKGAKGKVTFFYRDLKVQMLGKDSEDKATKKGLLSFLANAILIKDDNPTKGVARKADVQMERVPQASFFNLMWKSVFLGIRESVGIGIVPMKPMPEPAGKKRK